MAVKLLSDSKCRQAHGNQALCLCDSICSCLLVLDNEGDHSDLLLNVPDPAIDSWQARILLTPILTSFRLTALSCTEISFKLVRSRCAAGGAVLGPPTARRSSEH